MPAQDNVRGQIRSFILENYLFTDDQGALEDRSSLISGGVMDSMGMLDVINFLEDEFGFAVADHEMTPENLDSVDCLTTYVCTKSAVS